MARRELKDRVIYGHAAGDTASARSTSLSRPLKYKAWDESKMGQALSSVTKDGMSIREAALQFGVPKSTLGDRVSGRVLIGATSGPQTYLGRCEEEELVQFLLRCSEIGYAKSRKQVMALVRRVLLKKGKNAPVTSGWWESFCSRHPNLTLRAPAPLSKARAAASDPAILDRYFDLLQEVLVKNGLLGQACQIFNMDETGMPLDATHVKVVTQKGDRNLIAPSSGDKSQITVVACVNAAGSFMPPMVIIDRKTLPPHFTEGEVPGTAYGMSAKGWIDQELFDGWFTTHFLSYAPLVRPLLLLLDGHSSHYCPDTVRLAAKEKVIIFALPPNTTHITQPLDKGCFGPLKVCWKEECHNFMSDNPGKVVNRYVFSQLLSRAWSKAMSIRNIAGGFKVCGIYPFNRDALRVPLKEQPKQMETLAKDSGLAYIPLFSPARLNGSHHPRSNSLESSDSSCSSPSSRSSSVRRHRSSSVRRHRSSSVRCGRPSSRYHQYSSVWHDHPSKRRYSSSVGRGHSSSSQRHHSSSKRHRGRCSSKHHCSSSILCGHRSSKRHRSSSIQRGRRSSKRHHSSSIQRGRRSSKRHRSSSIRRGRFFSSQRHSSSSQHHRSSSVRHGYPSSQRQRSSSLYHGRPSSQRHHSSVRRHSRHGHASSRHQHSTPHHNHSSGDHSSSPYSTPFQPHVITSSRNRRSSSCPKRISSSQQGLHIMLDAHCSSLSSLLTLPEREMSKKTPPKKSFGRILTSVENIRAMEEKERVKKEKARLKEERKRELERKRQEKAQLAAERKRKMEAKKVEKARNQEQKKQSKKKDRSAHDKEKHGKDGPLSFTENEIKLFETRLENGYDLKTDERYNAWLKTKSISSVDQLSGGVSSAEPIELDDPPYNYSLDDSLFNLSLGTSYSDPYGSTG